MSFLETNIDDYISNEPNSSATSIVFECDELDDYDLPKEEDVPEGLYAAMIIGFQNYTDRFKNHYIDVCCKIFSDIAFIRWTNRVADQITYSYVRIRIKEDGDEKRQFRAAMRSVCKKKKFTSDELIGVILLVNIAYRGKGEAIIEKYKHTPLNHLWFEDDISNRFHWSSGYNPDEE